MNNEESDLITMRLRYLNPNQSNKKVTIIFIPCYLDGKDGILNLSYYDMIPGLDATIFPSYYEPWGYTPLESIAFGVPTISSDKAGFGQWILNNYKNKFCECGTRVISRTDSNYHEAKEHIAECIKEIEQFSEQEIEHVRSKAKLTSNDADWSKFMTHYIKAFKTACCRRDKRNNN